jgi:DNA-binding HxlR family transcriptional regulator
MTRFEILRHISKSLTPVTCKDLAKITGNPKAHTRSFQASLATRLRKLSAYGLLRRQIYKSGFLLRSKRKIHHWSITQRGIDRLSWAKSVGKLK